MQTPGDPSTEAAQTIGRAFFVGRVIHRAFYGVEGGVLVRAADEIEAVRQGRIRKIDVSQPIRFTEAGVWRHPEKR